MNIPKRKENAANMEVHKITCELTGASHPVKWFIIIVNPGRKKKRMIISRLLNQDIISSSPKLPS